MSNRRRGCASPGRSAAAADRASHGPAGAPVVEPGHERDRNGWGSARPGAARVHAVAGIRDSLSLVNVPRRCCRPGCPNYAVATLTFVYSDSTAVVGPLATVSEPHSWDLCVGHAGRITAPRGWELVRHAVRCPQVPKRTIWWRWPTPSARAGRRAVCGHGAVRRSGHRRPGGALMAPPPPQPDRAAAGAATCACCPTRH